MKNIKYLIGGGALRKLGSPRYTDDLDYLCDSDSQDPFFISEGNDHINANGHPFFRELYDSIEGVQEIAPPWVLLELKAFSFTQHCINGNWVKADNDEFDIKFLVRNFGLKELKIAQKYIHEGARKEVESIISNVRK